MNQLKHLKLLAILLLSVFTGSGQNVVKITNSATINFSSNVTFTINDLDLDNDGSFYPAVGQGRVVFTGSNSNVIRGTGNTGFDQLEIAKTGSGILNLENDFSVRSGIWFTSGNIELNNRTLTLLGNANLNNESENSRITGLNGGYVQLSMQLNNPQSVNAGNLGAVISSAENLGMTTIRRGHAMHTIAPGQTSISRFFDIIPSYNTALNATLHFEYLDAEKNNQVEQVLEFYRSADLLSWTNEGVTMRNESANYVVLQGIQGFSRWTLSGTGAALPVQFTNVWVQCENGASKVLWTTSQEVHSDFFEVQYSADGTTWQAVGIVDAAGFSSTVRNYSFTDPASKGKLYRVKEVDADGSVLLSKTVMASCSADLQWQVWPNPVPEKLNMTLNVQYDDRAKITIYDSRGRAVHKIEQSLIAGQNQVNVNMKNLAGGIYYIELILDKSNVIRTERIVKQ